MPHNTIKVVVHDTGSSTPLWIYDYPTSSGTYQEVCYDIDITDDGAYFIIGSWGDDANLNPEVHIFQRDSTPHIYYTVDMPGLVFSVDIANDGSYATAAGKHIHANVSGRGGDVVLINTDITGITNTESIDLPVEPLSLHAQPNPFVYETTIRYMIGEVNQNISGSARRTSEYQHPDLSIYDVGGRLVKDFFLPTTYYLLPTIVSWDGTDQANRQLPSGIYFVQLETGERIISQKIVKLE
jgi:hypothetical protein